MAGVVEEIFKLNGDSADITKKLQALKGDYQELTDEQQKQIIALTVLEKKEKDLIAARNKSMNPTTQIRYQKEIDNTVKAIGALTEATNKYTKSEHSASTEANALAKATANAFKGTTISAAAKDIDNIAKKFGDTGGSIDGVEKKTLSLKAQLRELKAQLADENLDDGEFERLSIEAGKLEDRINDASDAARVFATDSPFEAVGNAIGSVGQKLLNLDFAGAYQQSQLLVRASRQITFSQALTGLKQLGQTLFNIGKALLTNPLFLIGAVVAFIILKFNDLKNSTGLLGDAFRFIGKIIDGIIDTFYALTDALNLTSNAMDKNIAKTIKNAEELAERTKKSAEQQIAVAKALGKETEKQEVAKQNAYVKTLQVALAAYNRKSFLNEEEIKARQELVDKINDANNETAVIEATGYKKRADAAKKYTEDVNKLFEDLNKKIREARTKEDEFNIKFKFSEESRAQLEEVYKLRKRLEDEDIAEITKNAMKAAKSEKDKATAKEKITILSQQTEKNRLLDYNKAVLDVEYNNSLKQIQLRSSIAKRLNEASNLTPLGKANVQATIERNTQDEILRLLQQTYTKRKLLGLSTVELEKEVDEAILAGKIREQNEERELLQLNYQEAEKGIEFEKSHANTLLTLKNKSNSQKLYSDIKYEQDRKAAMEQAYGPYSREVKEQEDKITLMQKEALKQRRLEIIGYFETVSNAVLAAANQFISAEIQKADAQIQIQTKRLEEAKNIADRGNAQLLELEQKRLDDLTKQKEKFVRDQQALAAIELVANTAIAVSKAAAEGGAAAGVTIAAALIALVAGLASARSIASQAAFYDGGLYEGEGFTGHGNPFSESQNVGRKPYTYHKEEFIFNHGKTRQYRDIFEDIHSGRVNLRAWKEKVSAYDQMQMFKPFNMDGQMFASPQVTNIIRLESLESKMDAQTEAIRAIRFGLNIDEHGFTARQQSIIERNKFINSLHKP